MSNAKNNQLVIQNLRSYYNFSSKMVNGKYVIESTIFSDLENTVELSADSNNKLKINACDERITANKIPSYLDKKRRKIETHNVDLQINAKLITPKMVPSSIVSKTENEIIDFLNDNTIKKYNFCLQKCYDCKCKIGLDYSYSGGPRKSN